MDQIKQLQNENEENTEEKKEPTLEQVNFWTLLMEQMGQFYQIVISYFFIKQLLPLMSAYIRRSKM